MLQAPIQLPTSPHVIVVGNEKGGSGKTTVAMHIAIALMKAGQRVARIDFDRVITAVQHCHFLVIDTPPHDSYLMRLAHSIADTLVSPLNDSFLDLDVLATVDPVTFAVTDVSH